MNILNQNGKIFLSEHRFGNKEIETSHNRGNSASCYNRGELFINLIIKYGFPEIRPFGALLSMKVQFI